MQRRHSVLGADIDAGAPRRVDQRIHEAGADRIGLALRLIDRLAGMRQRPVERRTMHFPRHRVADRNAAALVRGLVGEGDTMGHQPVVGRDVVVGEGADDLAVVVAIVRKSVGLHHRPVGEILEHQVGRVVECRVSSARWFPRQAARCRH